MLEEQCRIEESEQAKKKQKQAARKAAAAEAAAAAATASSTSSRLVNSKTMAANAKLKQQLSASGKSKIKNTTDHDEFDVSLKQNCFFFFSTFFCLSAFFGEYSFVKNICLRS